MFKKQLLVYKIKYYYFFVSVVKIANTFFQFTMAIIGTTSKGMITLR